MSIQYSPNRTIIWFVGLLFFCHPIVKGQIAFERSDSIQVFAEDRRLKMPWAGGINFVQASQLDANYDGIRDLFIFDRSGNKPGVFLGEGLSDSVNFKLSRLGESFPAMREWALMADYNLDGKADIFTYSVGAFSVFKNTGSAASGIGFTLITEKVFSHYNSDYLPLYVTSVDIPSIIDVDNDGDLDVLTFSVNGIYLEYHQNRSMELYGVPDSLNAFYLETACWGNFKEDFSNCALTLDVPCFQKSALLGNQPQHAGSAVTALDLDGDNDKDVLLGDISCNTLSAIYNGGTIQQAQGTSQDATFPSDNIPVNLSIFPAAFHADVNNDGKRDLL
ncbi:MAG: FG-GAP repeat domain-containing protein, partial [Bacteroidota bacterium]